MGWDLCGALASLGARDSSSAPRGARSPACTCGSAPLEHSCEGQRDPPKAWVRRVSSQLWAARVKCSAGYILSLSHTHIHTHTHTHTHGTTTTLKIVGLSFAPKHSLLLDYNPASPSSPPPPPGSYQSAFNHRGAVGTSRSCVLWELCSVYSGLSL